MSDWPSVISVQGGTVNLVYVRFALAEVKPSFTGWQQFERKGIIGYDANGNTYWQETLDSPWERCGFTAPLAASGRS